MRPFGLGITSMPTYLLVSARLKLLVSIVLKVFVYFETLFSYLKH